jgi:hypothetical protein
MERRMPARLVVLVLALAALAAGCGEPQYHYVKNADLDTYFKVPSDWTMFPEADLKERLGANDLPPVLDRILWGSAFDASSDATLDNLIGPTAQPTGFAFVRGLTVVEQDDVSFGALRNFYIELDRLFEEKSAEPLDGNFDMPFSRGDLHGTRAVWAIETQSGPVAYDQIALLDPARSRVFFMVISCTTECYADNRRTIDELVNSLKVGEGI